ncbi:MAG: serine hydrolase domain-containing protein [Alphaproteobacteria bacterium]|jgi:CubicO group peptidase (beta-lactamase class C family)
MSLRSIYFDFFALLLFASMPADAAQERHNPVIVHDGLGKVLDTYLTRLSGYGYSFSILVAEAHGIVLEKAYGTGVTTDTVFNVASVAKQFTATAILKLASARKLRLEDQVRKYLPRSVPAFSHVTIDQLLAHTSGINDDYSLYGKEPALPREDYLARVLHRRLVSVPGKTWRYSNDGYALLARIVEVASGRPFKGFMREALFTPAALRETGFIGERIWPMARRDVPTGGTISPIPWRDQWAGGYGASDVITSPADLFRWQQAMESGRVLPSTWRAKLTQKVIDVFPPTLAYARGWWRRSMMVNRMPVLNIFHSGHEDDGSNAWFSHYPAGRLTVIFASGQSVEGEPLREALFSAGAKPGVLESLANGMAISLPHATTADDGPSGVDGVYRIDGDNWITIERHAPFAVASPHGQAAFDALLPQELRAAAPILSAFTKQTRTILVALAKGNPTPFEAAAGGARDDGTTLLPPKFDSYEVLGSRPVAALKDKNATIVTYVRLVRDRHPTVQHWQWSGGGLSAIYTNREPLVPLFRRVKDGAFMNFNPFTRQSAVIQFDANAMRLAGVTARKEH